MNEEIIKNLNDDSLLELYRNIKSNLIYQRKYWLENNRSRTEHFISLILETRNECEFIRKQIKSRGLHEN